MRKFLVLIALAGAVLSCEKIPRTTQDQYRKGLQAVEKRKWERAESLLEKALEGELSPSQKKQAKFALANAYFFHKDYENAVIHYEEFLQLYPASPEARIALYRLGISYLNLVKGPEWDQTFTRKAYKSFLEFIKRYPEDPLTEDAKRYARITRKILAEHEIYIAGTYDMIHKFTSSIKRYEQIIKEYGDVEPKDRLNFLLGRAYFFTTVQAEEEIKRLKKQLKKEKKKLKSKNLEERRVAQNLIALLKKDIEKWKEIARKNRSIGERILRRVAREYPNSPYGIKARKILNGEKILAVERVHNPLKRSLWWKLRKTL